MLAHELIRLCDRVEKSSVVAHVCLVVGESGRATLTPATFALHMHALLSVSRDKLLSVCQPEGIFVCWNAHDRATSHSEITTLATEAPARDVPVKEALEVGWYVKRSCHVVVLCNQVKNSRVFRRIKFQFLLYIFIYY